MRELRGVSWAAKAVACHLRFRQRDRECVSIGVARLALDLGLSKNAVSRAVRQAEARGLLKVLNRVSRKQGQRYVYDARPVDAIESVATSTTLSEKGKCRQVGDTTVLEVETVECPDSGDTSVSGSGTRQEVLKKNGTKKGKKGVADAALSPPPDSSALTLYSNNNGDGTEDGDANRERLIKIAFPGGASEKQRAAILNAVAEALRGAATPELLAHALVSRKLNSRKPWKRIDEAAQNANCMFAKAKAALAPDFEGTSLVDIYEYLNADGKIRKDAADVLEDLRAWYSQVFEWPGSAEAEIA